MTYPNTVISMPSQLFTMRSSFKAVANGSVYIGEVDTDPTIPTNQIQVYIEQENGTLVPVAQPIKINSAGLLTASGQVQKFVLTNTEYSMTVQNSYGVDEFYFPRVYDQGISAALEVEERLLGPGAKIYRGSNGQYVQNGDVVPSENPPYTHLSVKINGNAEDVAMSPLAEGSVGLLTEISATIGVTQVTFQPIDYAAPLQRITDRAMLSGKVASGQRIDWLGYYERSDGGANSGIVKTGAHTEDGGSIFSIDANTYIEANLKGKRINAKKFGLRGDYTTDDKAQFVKLLDYAPWGSEIYYPEGCYRIDGGHTHPLKQLKHVGAFAAPTFVPSADNIRGTSFYFPTLTGVNKGGLYMPPPLGSEFCRFSLIQDITLFGDGTDDDTGTVTCLKINNLGTHLKRVYSRYGAVGIENNYSVGAHWDIVHAIGADYGVHHVYDHDTPFGSELNSVATENNFSNILVATSKTNPNAIGWYQDATCQYANNHHGGQFDCEQCYTGAQFEGRISAKDHDSISVYGSAAFQSVGNVIDSAWFEANVGQNLVLSYDPSDSAPALTIRNLYQDVNKITSAGDTQLTLTTPIGDRPLKLGSTKDKPQGQTGTWQSPFTANQFLLHGKEGNFPLVRTIVEEKISKKAGNRASINEKGSYEFSYAKDNVPLVASTVNIANLELFSSAAKSVLIEYSIAATGNSGTHYYVSGKIAVNNDSDAITFVNLPSTESFLPAGTKPITLQPIRVASNTFGLFLFKDASVTQTVYATIDVKYIVGGGNLGDRQSILTTFSV